MPRTLLENYTLGNGKQGNPRKFLLKVLQNRRAQDHEHQTGAVFQEFTHGPACPIGAVASFHRCATSA
eukprot:jgi/Botrbrau1/9761/Bobra.85_1s0012.1